jgi:putative ABC transport system ATP-binding protein
VLRSDAPILDVENLVRYFKDGDGKPIKAIDGLTLRILPGEIVAVYGPSGSGKTTLMDLVAGFAIPDSGTVTVDSNVIADLSERDHADYLLWVLGIVGQPHELMPGATAQENAALKLLRPDARHASKLVVPLLEQLGLANRMKHSANTLSMGERQRVQIAQALSLNPKLVLADEPTSHLDTTRSREVLGLLRDLCRERETAVLLATHDPTVAAYADRVLELHDGRLKTYQPPMATGQALEAQV